MVRPITRRVLALVLFAAAAAPVRASEVYQNLHHLEPAGRRL